MFQTFDPPAAQGAPLPRLTALRAAMQQQGLDGFIIPRADEFQNEYVPPSAERLAWLTGFTGSWGLAIVLESKAAIFVDGRYTIQAKDEIDASLYEICVVPHTTPEGWLAANLPANARLGVDPWLHTGDQIKRYEAAVTKAGGSLVETQQNPLDTTWHRRPLPPCGEITLHPPHLAGETSQDKHRRIAGELTKTGATHLILAAPDAIAWAINIRGADVPHTPLPLSFAIVPASGRPSLFVNPLKLNDDTRGALAQHIDIHPQEAFTPALQALGKTGAAALIDPAGTAHAIATTLESAGGTIIARTDPTQLMKARKNEAEIEGTIRAHKRDALAMCKFLSWYCKAAQSPNLTEIDVVVALENFRRESGQLKDISFPTIAGSGPNGAIVHYRVSRASNRTLDRDSLFLVDSGAQYQDGTTDITRTLAIGKPPREMRERFTQVLKGMIAVSRARFPAGTTGAQLDSLARMPLWQAGIDYDHGTGHGVGSYLSVHEGPQRISKLGHVPLEPGMILSNEPGYYKTGAYGIRIENLLLVAPATPVAGGEREMLSFHTLTLVPISRKLILKSMLCQGERAWIDAYHARIIEEIGPMCDEQTRQWMLRVCAPL